MKRYKWIIILINLIVLLGYINSSILTKEKTLSSGTLVLLELAPVDPRSLIQGDYMTLYYAISERVGYDSIPKRGFCVIKLEENGVAKKIRLQENKTPLNNQEYLIRYSLNGWRGLKIGAESYFFQEGEAEKYENTKYGGVKIDDQGNSILIGLYDENRNRIK